MDRGASRHGDWNRELGLLDAKNRFRCATSLSPSAFTSSKGALIQVGIVWIFCAPKNKPCVEIRISKFVLSRDIMPFSKMSVVSYFWPQTQHANEKINTISNQDKR
jgi:hypothetical protein